MEEKFDRMFMKNFATTLKAKVAGFDARKCLCYRKGMRNKITNIILNCL